MYDLYGRLVDLSRKRRYKQSVMRSPCPSASGDCSLRESKGCRTDSIRFLASDSALFARSAPEEPRYIVFLGVCSKSALTGHHISRLSELWVRCSVVFLQLGICVGPSYPRCLSVGLRALIDIIVPAAMYGQLDFLISFDYFALMRVDILRPFSWIRPPSALDCQLRSLLPHLASPRYTQHMSYHLHWIRSTSSCVSQPSRI